MKQAKKRSYKHLTQCERDRIQDMLDSGHDEAGIARVLNRDKSTIGREIERNKRSRGDIPVINPEGYQATAADHKAYVRLIGSLSKQITAFQSGFCFS